MHSDHHYIDALRNNDPRGIREIYQGFSAQAQWPKKRRPNRLANNGWELLKKLK